MEIHDVLLLIGTIVYISINILFFIPIAYVMYCLINKYRAAKKKKPNIVLLSVNIFFCVVTATAVFGLLFMSCLKLQSIRSHADIHDNLLWRRYHGIFVLFYGKQNALMLLVLYLRVYYIFHETKMGFRKVTFWFFNIAFVLALMVFTAVPIIHTQKTQLSIWTICASSFCMYNVVFMTLLSYLFSSKLLASFRSVQGSGNRKGRKSVVNMMTKTSLLAMFSIAMTFTSCILLILRYSVHYESWLVYVSSNWLMSLDIYSNFFFVSLTMAYFDKYYQRVFGKLDHLLKKFLYWIVTRGNADSMRLAEYFEQHEKEVNAAGKKRPTTDATVSAPCSSCASKDGACSDAMKSATGGSQVRSVVHPTDGKEQTTDEAETSQEMQHGSHDSTDSIPSKQPEHHGIVDGGCVPVPSCSVISERVSTDSRSDAVVIAVEELRATPNGQQESPQLASKRPSRSVNRNEPEYAHQSSTTISSDMASEEAEDETPSTCTDSRSDDLV